MAIAPPRPARPRDSRDVSHGHTAGERQAGLTAASSGFGARVRSRDLWIGQAHSPSQREGLSFTPTVTRSNSGRGEEEATQQLGGGARPQRGHSLSVGRTSQAAAAWEAAREPAAATCGHSRGPAQASPGRGLCSPTRGSQTRLRACLHVLASTSLNDSEPGPAKAVWARPKPRSAPPGRPRCEAVWDGRPHLLLL